MKNDDDLFRDRYGLGDGRLEYSIEGGAVPVRVHNVEGIVGVIAVTGLSQAENHMCAVEALQELQRGFE